MQKMADNIWILSNLDLKICMQALGYKGEMDFPVMQRERLLKRKNRIVSRETEPDGVSVSGRKWISANRAVKREFFRNYKFRSETESAEKRKYADCVL